MVKTKRDFDKLDKKELIIETNRLKAEGFICRVELDCLFDLGNREKLIKEYLEATRR